MFLSFIVRCQSSLWSNTLDSLSYTQATHKTFITTRNQVLHFNLGLSRKSVSRIYVCTPENPPVTMKIDHARPHPLRLHRPVCVLKRLLDSQPSTHLYMAQKLGANNKANRTTAHELSHYTVALFEYANVDGRDGRRKAFLNTFLLGHFWRSLWGI